MKKIQPVQIWDQGILKTAEFLQVTGIFDNYESSATNLWALFAKVINDESNESSGQQLAQGNLIIDGQNYIDWGNVPASSVNEWIYNWTAQQINVTIIP